MSPFLLCCGILGLCCLRLGPCRGRGRFLWLVFHDDGGHGTRTRASSGVGCSRGVLGALVYGIFRARELRVVLVFGRNLHGCIQILHEANLTDPIDKGLATEDTAEELGRVNEALAGLCALLSILVVGCPQFFIGQYLVGLTNDLELFVRRGIVGVLV